MGKNLSLTIHIQYKSLKIIMLQLMLPLLQVLNHTDKAYSGMEGDNKPVEVLMTKYRSMDLSTD